MVKIDGQLSDLQREEREEREREREREKRFIET